MLTLFTQHWFDHRKMLFMTIPDAADPTLAAGK
jgi:hypothetical protein